MVELKENAAIAAQKVSTSQGEIMEAQSSLQAEQVNEGATTMVAGENNNEFKNKETMTSLKETGDKVMPKNEKSIVELRQEAEDAKKAVEENADGLKTKQKARGVIYRKAVKAVKTWFEKQSLPLLPVLFCHTESDEKDAMMITKKEAEIIIGISDYNLQTKPTVIDIATECLTDPLFEYDAPKYVTPADLFYNNGIELKDLNGNTIPKNTPNVYVPVGGAATHAVFCAAHKLNIEAEVNNTPKIILNNVRVKNLNTMQELGKYIGNNTVLDRALNSKEQAGVAALATEDELMQRVFKISIEKEIPKSTAFKYYALGGRLNPKQWKQATRGIMPKDIKYDLTAGERTIDILVNKGVGELIKSRYLIDAITKFARQPKGDSKELNGFDLALHYLEQLTPHEVKRLIETHSDKMDMLYGFLVEKRTLASQQEAA